MTPREAAEQYAATLVAEGLEPQSSHHPRSTWDMERFYVTVVREGLRYTVQFNECYPNGSPVQVSTSVGADLDRADDMLKRKLAAVRP